MSKIAHPDIEIVAQNTSVVRQISILNHFDSHKRLSLLGVSILVIQLDFWPHICIVKVSSWPSNVPSLNLNLKILTKRCVKELT